jgi:hypothetical protein
VADLLCFPGEPVLLKGSCCIGVFGFFRRWFWVGWLVVTGLIGLWCGVAAAAAAAAQKSVALGERLHAWVCG